MIGVVFEFATEVVEVRLDGIKVWFRTGQLKQWASIDGIKLDKSGVIREFPDLKDNKDWQNIARERFKEKIKKMNTEEERINYIIEDLKKFGYKPLLKRKAGFRPQKIK